MSEPDHGELEHGVERGVEIGIEAVKRIGRMGRFGRTAGIAALGTGAALAVGWAAQRRFVARSLATADEMRAEGLDMPADAKHYDIETDDGGSIHVVRRGKGMPLVLLHGVFLNSTVWVHQFNDLADEFEVIALDLRGHGQSVVGSDGFGLEIPGSGEKLMPDDAPQASVRRRSRPSRRRVPPPALERMAMDVRQVLRSLDVEHAVLVGHSMGGMIAIQAVAGLSHDERHSRLAGLMLTSTTSGPMLGVPGWDAFASFSTPAALRLARTSVLAKRGAIPKGDVRWWASRLAFGAEAPAVQVRFLENMLGEATQPTMEGLLESLARVNLSGLLGSVDLPTLVTVGTHDRLTPPWHSRRLEGRLPEARLVELARCGHMPMLERRREFDRLLEEHALKVS
ncbi:MAG: alpha/beta hydrolase [Acidimicrobiales bacterium]